MGWLSTVLKGGKSIAKNRDDIKRIVKTIKNPPRGGIVDKLINSLHKEFGIPLNRIYKMINKKDGGDVSKYEAFLKKHNIQELPPALKAAIREGHLHQKEEMEAHPDYPKKLAAIRKRDAPILKAEKARRIRAKNKAKPMGKKHGGIINSRAIAKKYFKGGMV